MGVEIERKFRLAELPAGLDRHPRVRIEQGYLAIEGGGGVEVRLRRKGDGRLLTVKRGAGGTRLEQEVYLDDEQFESLWPLTEGRRVAKVRHVIPQGPVEVEIDVFEGPLAGMMIAEVEFDSEAASEAFEPPDWLGEEVTGDPRYTNESLAVDGPPEEGRRR